MDDFDFRSDLELALMSQAQLIDYLAELRVLRTPLVNPDDEPRRTALCLALQEAWSYCCHQNGDGTSAYVTAFSATFQECYNCRVCGHSKSKGAP